MIGDVLTSEGVRVGARAADLHDAIEQVGAILVTEGLVTDGYIKAMHEREAIVSTYLGNGIALPHGTNDAQDTILRTGLAVVQFPDGVPWGEEPARLVIGLAARSDEHIEVLSRLATILGDAEVGTVPENRQTAEGGGAHEELPPGIPRTVRISNPSGLHARPAAQVVARLQPLDAQVTLEVNGKRADARSITATLGLGASVGDELTITVHGPDATAALDAVLAIVTSGSDI